MRRLWKLLTQNTCSKTLLKPCYLNPTSPKPFSSTPLPPRSLSCMLATEKPPSRYFVFQDKVSDKISELKGELIESNEDQISELKNELIESNGDCDVVYRLMEDKGLPLLSDGRALIQLMTALQSSPQLALEVFNWRRNQKGLNSPITTKEYAKGIIVAGRAKNIDLAVELFREAAKNNVKTSSTYNALMRVYLNNYLPYESRSLFEKFKMDATCVPTITTYNILISLFGRLMLVDHMEETLREIYASNVSPDVTTFNNLIAGYVAAWKWDHMENSYKTMKMASIEPDTKTHMLMLRGYAYSGNLTKMEDIFQLLKKEDFIRDNLPLVRSMICAYCKSSLANRVEKIDALMKMIPEEEYRSWLTVILIKVYAEEELVDRMEEYIHIAFKNHTAVTNPTVMKAIHSVYYKLRDVDKLASFVERAEKAGWKLCRSMYHCKMVLYRKQNRLEEMESVLGEMDRSSIWSQTKKALEILCEGYSKFGPRCKLEQVAGLMFKRGYGIPMERWLL